MAPLLSRRAVLALPAILPASMLASRAMAAEPVIRMAYFDSYGPFSYRSESGTMQGLLIESMDLLCRNAGIGVSHHGYPWSRAQALVEAGELDGLCTVPTPARRDYTQFCETPVVVVRFGVFHRRDDARFAALSSKDDFKDIRMGNYLGNGWAQQNLDGLLIDWSADEDAVLRKIAAGRLDAYVSGELVTLHKLRKLGLSDQFSFTPTPFFPAGDFTFGLRRSFADGAALVDRMEAATREANTRGDLRRLQNNYV